MCFDFTKIAPKQSAHAFFGGHVFVHFGHVWVKNLGKNGA